MPQLQTLTSLKKYPISGASRLDDIEQALTADELTMLVENPTGDQFIIGGRFGSFSLAPPAAPVITTTGGAAGSQSYEVVATLGLAFSQASPVGSTSTGPTTLSGTTFNTLNWAAVPGATSYNVYRTAGGTTQGLIATTTLLTLNDTGLAGDTTTPPSVNYSGILYGRYQEHTTAYLTSGAITAFGTAMITDTSVAVLTLALPVAGAIAAGGQDGLSLTIYDTTGHAHTVTTPANGIKGSTHIATFGGTPASFITLRAFNGVWWPLSLSGVTLS